MSSTVRDPAVAGTFYPARPEALRAMISACLAEGASSRSQARLLMAPHAGLVYSGRIAGRGYARVEIPPLVVVLAPNHYGVGAQLALPRSGAWRTPLGTLSIDERATSAITSAAGPAADFRDDWRAHARDHALEIQLPFLQVACEERDVPMPAIVTLSCGTHELASLVAAGEALAGGLVALHRDSPRDVLLVVSSDMSHYIPEDEARALDIPALEMVRRCEPEALHREVTSKGITMCGIAPAVAGLAAARVLGAGPGELVAYGTSGDVSGDRGSVVAYASVLLDVAESPVG